MRRSIINAAANLLRFTVLVVTVILCAMMFDKGGWWIAVCLCWLPVNFIVVAVFGDADSSTSSDVAEAATFGDE